MDCRYAHGYEPVPRLHPVASDGLLQFTSCICHEIATLNGTVARKTVSRAFLNAEYAKELHARIASMMALSLEKIQILTFDSDNHIKLLCLLNIIM